MGLLDTTMDFLGIGGSAPEQNPAYTTQAPYLKDVYSKSQKLFNSGAGQTPPWLQEFFKNAAGGGMNSQTASGQYLNSNPYIDAMFNKASEGVTRNYTNAVVPTIRGNFGMAGGYNRGSEQMALGDAQRNLGSTLGNLSTDIYGGNYARERGFMENAQGRNMDVMFQGANASRDMAMDPWRRMQAYSQTIGGPQQPLTGQQGGNPLMGALGGASLGAGLFPAVAGATPWGAMGGAALGLLGSR
jgi:hypothetical protein